jgi:predicted TIM-barrel fold metal-dependent hydrolase
MSIIDFHVHIFPEKIAEKATRNIGAFYGIPMCHNGTVPNLLELGTKAGIDRFLVHSTATKPEQVQSINDFVSGEVQKHPDRLIGFGTLHPGMEGAPAEIDRMIRCGLQGVKLHPDFQLFNADDRSMYPIYEELSGQLPVLVHAGDNRYDYSSPLRIDQVARDFPNLTIIAAHLGGYTRWDEAYDVLYKRKNIYIDTCSSLAFLPPERAREIIHHYGVERVLFGTDFPMWDQEEELARFDALGLTQNEREAILHENAERLLGLTC